VRPRAKFLQLGFRRSVQHLILAVGCEIVAGNVLDGAQGGLDVVLHKLGRRVAVAGVDRFSDLDVLGVSAAVERVIAQDDEPVAVGAVPQLIEDACQDLVVGCLVDGPMKGPVGAEPFTQILGVRAGGQRRSSLN
jgi:hypothetical protein